MNQFKRLLNLTTSNALKAVARMQRDKELRVGDIEDFLIMLDGDETDSYNYSPPCGDWGDVAEALLCLFWDRLPERYKPAERAQKTLKLLISTCKVLFGEDMDYRLFSEELPLDCLKQRFVQLTRHEQLTVCVELLNAEEACQVRFGSFGYRTSVEIKQSYLAAIANLLRFVGWGDYSEVNPLIELWSKTALASIFEHEARTDRDTMFCALNAIKELSEEKR